MLVYACKSNFQYPGCHASHHRGTCKEDMLRKLESDGSPFNTLQSIEEGAIRSGLLASDFINATYLVVMLVFVQKDGSYMSKLLNKGVDVLVHHCYAPLLSQLKINA